MTIRELLLYDLSDAARVCFLTLQEDRVEGGIQGLADILDWSTRKTQRIVRELESAGLLRVQRQHKTSAQFFVVDDKSVAHSVCSDTDVHYVPEQSEQTEQGAPDMTPMPDLSGKAADPVDDLRMRMEAIALRGIEWVLRTFPSEMINEHLTIVEELARAGTAHNPAGLLNSSLRGRCLLFRPERLIGSSVTHETAPEGPQSLPNGRSPAEVGGAHRAARDRAGESL